MTTGKALDRFWLTYARESTDRCTPVSMPVPVQVASADAGVGLGWRGETPQQHRRRRMTYINRFRTSPLSAACSRGHARGSSVLGVGAVSNKVNIADVRNLRKRGLDIEPETGFHRSESAFGLEEGLAEVGCRGLWFGGVLVAHSASVHEYVSIFCFILL